MPDFTKIYTIRKNPDGSMEVYCFMVYSSGTGSQRQKSLGEKGLTEKEVDALLDKMNTNGGKLRDI